MPGSVGLQRRCGATGEISEPVPEDFGWRHLGGDIATESEGRKLGAQRQLALGACPLLKGGEPALGLDLEIAGRDGRRGTPFARDEAGDVTQIFPLQLEGVVFRMPLKEDETAAQLL